MRVSYEGDPPPLAWLGKARQELERLQARLDTAGLAQGTFQHVLSDDAYCYGYILPNGIRAIHIVGAPGAAPDVRVSVAQYPDFVSGTVIGGELEPGSGQIPDRITTYYPTAATCALHRKEVGATADAPVKLPRLAVRLWVGFDELESQDPRTVLTQYSGLRPTMYSGKMRQVVQAVMGFGKRQKKSIYDTVVQAQVIYPNDPPQKPDPATQTMTAYDRSTLKPGVQVRFDYRFARTHGIVTAADGKPWLVEIGMNRGVLVMPLPLFSGTDGAPFRLRVANVFDDDGLLLLDTLGGFPSGEAFPTSGPELEAWIRAGKIQRLVPAATMSEFYAFSAYSQAMGWAFSQSGHEAHNTAYDWDEVTGIQVGVHYMIPFAIGATAAVTVAARTALKASFASLQQDNPDTFAAAMWKLDRLGPQDLASVMAESTLKARYQALDALLLTPPASASAHLAKVAQGNIYWPSQYCPQIKFPEYLLGFLLSHDMRPDRPGPVQSVRCDTTMHVFFIGDQLHWCKFFSDPRVAAGGGATQSGDSAEAIAHLPVGNLAQTITSGPIGVPAMFYTSDIDDREALGTSVEQDIYKRANEGPYEILSTVDGVGDRAGNGYSAGDNLTGPPTPDWPFGFGGVRPPTDWTGWRMTRFRWEQWQTVTNGPSRAAAIAVPFFDRCAYYYGRMDGAGEVRHMYSLGWQNMGSPWIAWWGDLAGGDTDGTIKESMYLQPVDPDHSVYQRYQDFADDGDWVPVGAMMREIVTTTPVNINAGAYTTFSTDPTTKVLTVQLVADAPQAPLQTYTETRSGYDATYWDSWWFLPSPDPQTGLTCSIHETHNALGGADALCYEETLNGAMRVLGAPNLPPMLADSRITFVGVVNG